MVGVMNNYEQEAIRVEVEGPTASFRYPHFLIGRQPSYSMPPPSTVYGLIAGVLGDLPHPEAIRFAYRFECIGDPVDDVELIWFVEPNMATRGATKDINITATSNVLPREWLVFPRMTLYLTGENLEQLYAAFRAPHYVPVLGRSQDLVSFRRVDRVRLKRKDWGRFDPTLLPIRFRDRLPFGSSTHMPRFIRPENRRRVEWDWFITLDQSVTVGQGLQFQPEPEDILWADPDTLDPDTGRERLLVFHSFTADDARPA